MNRLMSLTMSLAMMALPFVACALAEPNDEKDVRQVVGSFAETWNLHDMEAFGRLFAPDADFVNVAGDWWKGRQAIQRHHAYSHGTIPADTPGEPLPLYGIFKTSTLRFTEIDVRFLRKDVAVAHASCELLGDARTANLRHCLITFVLTQQDGGWLIAAAQNTEINRTVK